MTKKKKAHHKPGSHISHKDVFPEPVPVPVPPAQEPEPIPEPKALPDNLASVEDVVESPKGITPGGVLWLSVGIAAVLIVLALALRYT